MKRALAAALICLCAALLPTEAQTTRRAPARGASQAKPAAPAPTPAAKRTPADGASQPGAPQTKPAAPAPSTASATPDECGCEPKGLPDVLAVVNGVQVRAKDFTPATQSRIDELKKQVVEARTRELDLQINSRLLSAEAKKRGVTATKLLEDEVVAKAKEPTEADARAFYDQNRRQIQGEFAQVREQLVAYLREQRQQEAARGLAERLRAAAAVKVNVAKPTPPASDADRARILATVNGEPVTSADVEDALKPLIASVQEQVFALRKREVDMRINDILLEEEARKRGTTAAAILDAEVNSKVAVVTEADAQKFYNDNKARINGEFAQVKYQIIQYLEGQSRERATQALAQRLRNAASVQTFIRRPDPVVFEVATDDQPAKGNPAASVTLVEFTDYECPSCAATQPVIERIAAEYGDRVRVVIRDFPLAQHRNAFKAAEAAEAAREQGKYWEYVALLFRNQSALSAQNLRQYALAAGLDVARFDAALSSGKFAEKVQRDMLDGQKIGVNSTPTIFVNGRAVSDISYEGIKQALDEALKSAPPAAKRP